MVVDPQGNPLQQRREGRRKHPGGGHVGADQGVRFLRPGFGQAVNQRAETVGDLGVFQHMSGLSQQPQATAQGGGGADGIPIGAAVSQDAEIVMVSQIIRGFIPRQFLHPVSLPES